MNSLDPILTYHMNEAETKAYKLCLIWQDITDKELPNYKKDKDKLRKNGDPRKSLLFKYCYKLVRETEGIITDADYPLYMMAQIHTLKSIKEGDMHALITSQCLVGDKAWRRWQMWKKKYDKAHLITEKDHNVEQVATQTRVNNDLLQTKNFLVKKFNGEPTFEQFQQAFKELFVIKWSAIGKLSPFYILLSPFVKRALNGRQIERVFVKDLRVYQPSITKQVEDYFKTLFTYEFKS
jgi:hypothetical protein